MKHLALILLSAVPLVAAAPQGFVHWKAVDLKGQSKALAGKMSEQKIAAQPLGKWGNHNVQVSHRGGDGVPEVHESVVDFFVVEGGEATLVVGGKVEGGKTTAPGEVRGGKIVGGESVPLTAGDIVHIPHNTPHQLLVPKSFDYFVIKVEVK
jgi:mannose-6-phosphate isomerase-like protein (cupin superfamily)